MHSVFGKTHYEGQNAENLISKGVGVSAPFLVPSRKGWWAKKKAKNLKIHYVSKGHDPKNTIFNKNKLDAKKIS